MRFLRGVVAPTIAVVSGVALAACGDGVGYKWVVESHILPANGSYSIVDERPLSRPLTSDNYGTGYPATYRQKLGGELVIHGDGTGWLDKFLIPDCSGPVAEWHEFSGPVRFAEEDFFGIWLYSTDGALLLTVYMDFQWTDVPFEVQPITCAVDGEDVAYLVREDEWWADT